MCTLLSANLILHFLEQEGLPRPTLQCLKVLKEWSEEYAGSKSSGVFDVDCVGTGKELCSEVRCSADTVGPE